MKKAIFKNGKLVAEVLPERYAQMPERQREAMQLARKDGKFDGKAHLEKSPVFRAIAHGFPLTIR